MDRRQTNDVRSIDTLDCFTPSLVSLGDQMSLVIKAISCDATGLFVSMIDHVDHLNDFRFNLETSRED